MLRTVRVNPQTSTKVLQHDLAADGVTVHRSTIRRTQGDAVWESDAEEALSLPTSQTEMLELVDHVPQIQVLLSGQAPYTLHTIPSKQEKRCNNMPLGLGGVANKPMHSEKFHKLLWNGKSHMSDQHLSFSKHSKTVLILI
ncbi:hypothetical protein NFI96_003217 [Prochilodus magdalenae]|nr:hypothetical protein NFI96_003217 [Prochilodus magdalenae]